MRRTFTGLLVVLLLLTVGCPIGDPGMTIRQAVQRGSLSGLPATPSPSYLGINVKTSHPFQGETWYAPTVTVTNSFESPITVSAVELVVRGVTYANGRGRAEAYPVVVLPGKTETLDIWFDLRENVWKTFFKQSAELRVHYRKDAREEIAHASIIGGHLDLKWR